MIGDDALIQGNLLEKEIVDLGISFFKRISEQPLLHEKIAGEIVVNGELETLEGGRSGEVLIILELYKVTKQRSLLVKAEQMINGLFKYCKEQHSNNFSFYSGRAGFFYTAIELFKINNDYAIIKRIGDLIKPCMGDFLKSTYVNNYLYNGRSGTLIILMELYSITKDNVYLESIRQYAHKIIADGIFSDKGLCWRATYEIGLHPSCGFGKGSGGILYTMNLLNTFFPDGGTDVIIEKIAAYQDGCWDEKIKNWPDLGRQMPDDVNVGELLDRYNRGDFSFLVPSTDNISWLNGMTGVLSSFASYARSSVQLDRLEGILIDKIEQTDIGVVSHSLSEGISGVGLYLLAADNADFSVQIEKLTKEVYKSLKIRNDTGAVHADFLNGDTGVLYFLLKSIQRNYKGGNVLMPGWKNSVGNSFRNINVVPHKQDFLIELLLKVYPLTIKMVKAAFPDLLAEYLTHCISEPRTFGIVHFKNFISRKTDDGGSDYNMIMLKGKLIFEFLKYEFTIRETRTDLELYLEMLDRRIKIMTCLNKNEDWLLESMCKNSGNFLLVNSDIYFDNHPRSTLPKVILRELEDFEILVYPTEKFEFIEVSSKLIVLAVRCFASTKTIRQGIVEMKLYMRELSSDLLEAFFGSAGVSNAKDLFSRLDYILVNLVRQLLYQDLLRLTCIE